MHSFETGGGQVFFGGQERGVEGEGAGREKGFIWGRIACESVFGRFDSTW